ncbi:MAG: hypothetical protein JWO03_2784 [Bacteroidetes bacterium]|nr:hypothetical protein [Bacteroidota bacterium]
MKNFTKILSTAALLFVLLFSPDSAKATHFKGGDIYFECMGNGTYRLVFTCYYSCEAGSSLPYDPSVIFWDLTSTCPGVPTSLVALSSSVSSLGPVPLYCRNILTSCDYYANGAIPPGTPDGTLLEKYVSDTFHIPPGCSVTAEMDQGSRNGAITNLIGASGYDIDIVATVTTPADGSCENNPEFASFPVNIFCINENAVFSQGAIDLSGDSLVYSLINPRTTGGAPIPFVTGCTPTNPLGAPSVYASSFTFDSHNGNINFTPTQTGNYVLAILVNAYHNGVLVSSTMRDIQILVINCVSVNNSPNLLNYFTPAFVSGATIYDSTHIGVCPGQLVQFNLAATDRDSFNYVSDSADFARVLPGSVVSVTHTGTKYDTATLHVSWIPQNADSGFHYIYLTVSDTFCPRPGTRTYAFVISVLTGLYAGPNLVYCNGGQPVTIQAHGASHYTWTDSASGGPPIGVVSYSADSSAITVAPPTPNVSVGYVVRGDLIGSCKNLDTVSVKNVPRFSLASLAQDPSICKYTSTTVSTTATPANVGPYTYVWTPTSQVLSPATPSTAITPLLNDTWFSVKVTAVGGCVITDSVQVRISGSAPRISIIPSNNNVCPGDTVTLTGLAFAENLVVCGLVDTCPDNTILTNQAIGTDTSSRTNIETPYCGDYPSARTQYLIRASELNAAGLSSGAITDISFYVKQITSTVGYDSFTVSMGCTSLDSLTGFVGNLLEVSPPSQVLPNTGWSPHPFLHFYNWDGYSNIVIQVCYTRTSTSFNNSDYVAYTTTSYNGSTLYDRDFGTGANGCGLNSFPTISNIRPIIKMGICAPNVLTYQWTPSTLLCDTCAVTTVVVPTDSVYTLTVHDGICVNDSAFRVTINRNIAIHATPDTTLCGLDTVQLNVALANAPPSTCLLNYNVISIPYSSIVGTGTIIPTASYQGTFGPSTDDGVAGPFNIGFPFNFYCQTYNNFWVNSNAWISLINPYPNTTGGLQYIAQTFPPAAAFGNPLKEIALMVGDYQVSATSTASYFTTGTAPNRICVVKFNTLRSLSGTYTTTGEIHMHEGTGVVEVMILNSNYVNTNHTTGLKDSVGIGIAAPGRNNVPYTITASEGWRFIPQNGSTVALGTTVWTPNISLSDDSIVNPLATPTTGQTYYVDEYLTINQFTNPTTCHVRDSVTVNVTSFSHSVTASPVTVCPGDTSRLTFTSGNTISNYTWTPSSLLSDATVFNPLATVYDTTRFVVNVVDNNGCRGIDSVTVNVFPTPHPHVGPSVTLCYYDAVQLSVSGTYTDYQWFVLDPLSPSGRDTLGTASTINAHPPGDYIVRVLAAGSTCYYFSDTAHIDSFPHPLLHVTSSGPDSFCTGGNVILQTDQGYSNYNWTPAGGANQNVPVQTTGDYSYTAEDANGCHLFSDTAHIRVSDPPVITLNNYKDPICTTDTDVIIATTSPAGYPIEWSLNGTVIATGNPLVTNTPGNYTVVASIGCPATLPFVLTGAVSPTVRFDIPGPISACGCGTSIVVTAILNPASAATYIWSADSSTGSSYGIDSSGTYAVTVTDVNHCTVSDTITATITCPKVITSALPDSIFPSDTTTLSVLPLGGTVLTAYQWTPSSNVLVPNAASTGATAQHPGIDTFYVTVTDNNGCTNTVPVYITVIEQGNFRMATAFTPNGDGRNDKFFPVLNGPNSTSKVIAFRVYNRWGQLLYDNPNAPGWDGGYGGTPQATDTYTYFVTVESPDPSDASKKVQKSVEGSFQLFR